MTVAAAGGPTLAPTGPLPGTVHKRHSIAVARGIPSDQRKAEPGDGQCDQLANDQYGAGRVMAHLIGCAAHKAAPDLGGAGTAQDQQINLTLSCGLDDSLSSVPGTNQHLGGYALF